jgi:tetratricopeptide (TPR) repeat protein
MKRPLQSLLVAVIFLLLGTAVFADTSVSKDQDYLYSKALMLKSQGEFAKAVDVFSQLLPGGKEADHIYYQIASCYASQLEYSKAQDFARKSISENQSFIDPYQLIYDINMTLKNYEAAADILEDITEVNPSLIQFQYLKATLYFQQMNNPVMAEVSLQKVLNIARESSVPTFYKEQSHILLSEIYLQQKENDKALAELDAAVELNLRDNLRYYRLASYFITSSNINSAREALERFIPSLSESQKQNPLIKTMYAYLGNIYYITDDPQALRYLRMGAGNDNIDCLTAQYTFYSETGRSEEAAPVLEKIRTDYPKYITPNVALGRIALEKGDTEKAYTCFLAAAQLLYKTDMPTAAINCYLKALSIKPDSAEIHLILGQLYESTGKNALAAMHYIAYCKMKPDVEILLHLSYLYDNDGKKDRSAAYMAQAETDYSDSSRVYFFKGILASRAENQPEAERQLEKAILLKNDDPNYYYYLAVTCEKLKENDKAINALKKGLELDPENASYLNFLGYLYVDENVNIDQASAYIGKAVAKDPNNGAYLDSLGWLYFRQGKTDIAILKLKQAQRILAASDESDPVVYDHLGEAYLKTGNKKKAVESWQKSLDLKPDPAVKKKIELQR